MTLTTTEIYDRLVAQADNGEITLPDGFAESDVQSWLDNIDVGKLESAADEQITRDLLPDLDAQATDSTTLREVIESHNDEPSNFSAGYVIRADRTYVQYFKPNVGEKKPMDKQTAQAELDKHINRLVDNAVASELFSRAKTEFSV